MASQIKFTTGSGPGFRGDRGPAVERDPTSLSFKPKTGALADWDDIAENTKTYTKTLEGLVVDHYKKAKWAGEAKVKSTSFIRDPGVIYFEDLDKKHQSRILGSKDKEHRYVYKQGKKVPVRFDKGAVHRGGFSGDASIYDPKGKKLTEAEHAYFGKLTDKAMKKKGLFGKSAAHGSEVSKANIHLHYEALDKNISFEGYKRSMKFGFSGDIPAKEFKRVSANQKRLKASKKKKASEAKAQKKADKRSRKAGQPTFSESEKNIESLL